VIVPGKSFLHEGPKRFNAYVQTGKSVQNLRYCSRPLTGPVCERTVKVPDQILSRGHPIGT
jgi:hypothetical protein